MGDGIDTKDGNVERTGWSLIHSYRGDNIIMCIHTFKSRKNYVWSVLCDQFKNTGKDTLYTVLLTWY